MTLFPRSLGVLNYLPLMTVHKCPLWWGNFHIRCEETRNYSEGSEEAVPALQYLFRGNSLSRERLDDDQYDGEICNEN